MPAMSTPARSLRPLIRGFARCAEISKGCTAGTGSSGADRGWPYGRSPPLGTIALDRTQPAASAESLQGDVNATFVRWSIRWKYNCRFLQRLLDHFELIPLAVGDASGAEWPSLRNRCGADRKLIGSTIYPHTCYAGATVDPEHHATILRIRTQLPAQSACGAITDSRHCDDHHRRATFARLAQFQRPGG